MEMDNDPFAEAVEGFRVPAIEDPNPATTEGIDLGALPDMAAWPTVPLPPPPDEREEPAKEKAKEPAGIPAEVVHLSQAGGAMVTLGARRHPEVGINDCLPTGIPAMDAKTLRLKRAELILLGGISGGCKTAFATQLAINMAIAGYTGYYVSIEMSLVDMLARMLAAVGHCRNHALNSGTCSDQEWADAEHAYETIIRGLDLYIDTRQMVTVEMICQAARAIKAMGGKLDFLAVDHAQIVALDPSRRGGSRDVGDVGRALRNLARELNIVVILLSQANSKFEGRLLAAKERDKGSIVPVYGDIAESQQLI